MAINSDVDINEVLNSLNKKPESLAISSKYPPMTIVRWDKGDGDDQPTDDEINTEWERLKTAKAAVKYQGDRKKEYPAIGDQLDSLYHAGVFPADMAAKLKAVKDKYPKPGG